MLKYLFVYFIGFILAALRAFASWRNFNSQVEQVNQIYGKEFQRKKAPIWIVFAISIFSWFGFLYGIFLWYNNEERDFF